MYGQELKLTRDDFIKLHQEYQNIKVVIQPNLKK